MYSFPRFLGIEAIPSNARGIIYKFMLMDYTSIMIAILSNTFFILYIIGLIGFTQASIIASIMLLVQLLTDYPSGSLGDWIGQRWVLAIAYTSYTAAYYLLTLATSFNELVIIAIIIGFANAMASGALGTWLDNNYKYEAGDSDPEKRIYGFSMARITTLRRLFLATGVVFGGFLATTISRKFIFLLQSFLFILYILLIIIIMKEKNPDSDNVGSNKEVNLNLGEYFKFLKGGIQFIFSSKVVFFFITGFANC